LPTPAVAAPSAPHAEPEYADEIGPAVQVRAVMPKGRNFH
jgi:hypothetical protein